MEAEEILNSNQYFVNFEDKRLKSTFVMSTTLPNPATHIISMKLRNVVLNNNTTVFEILSKWKNEEHARKEIEIDLFGGKEKSHVLTRFVLNGCQPGLVYIPTDLDYSKCEPLIVEVQFTYDYYVTLFSEDTKSTND